MEGAIEQVEALTIAIALHHPLRFIQSGSHGVNVIRGHVRKLFLPGPQRRELVFVWRAAAFIDLLRLPELHCATAGAASRP